MYAVYAECEFSMYAIRNSKEEAQEAIAAEVEDYNDLRYESGGECEDMEDALRFMFSEWFHITEEDAAEAMKLDEVRERFIGWGL